MFSRFQKQFRSKFPKKDAASFSQEDPVNIEEKNPKESHPLFSSHVPGTTNYGNIRSGASPGERENAIPASARPEFSIVSTRRRSAPRRGEADVSESEAGKYSTDSWKGWNARNKKPVAAFERFSFTPPEEPERIELSTKQRVEIRLKNTLQKNEFHAPRRIADTVCAGAENPKRDATYSYRLGRECVNGGEFSEPDDSECSPLDLRGVELSAKSKLKRKRGFVVESESPDSTYFRGGDDRGAGETAPHESGVGLGGGDNGSEGGKTGVGENEEGWMSRNENARNRREAGSVRKEVAREKEASRRLSPPFPSSPSSFFASPPRAMSRLTSLKENSNFLYKNGERKGAHGRNGSVFLPISPTPSTSALLFSHRHATGEAMNAAVSFPSADVDGGRYRENGRRKRRSRIVRKSDLISADELEAGEGERACIIEEEEWGERAREEESLGGKGRIREWDEGVEEGREGEMGEKGETGEGGREGGDFLEDMVNGANNSPSKSQEIEDPVLSVLWKCEKIAEELREKLRGGRRGGKGRNGSKEEDEEGDGERWRDEYFSETQESAARLVSQSDILAACAAPPSSPTPLPPSLGPSSSLSLKPYQLVGVNFLLLLYQQGVGGAILADEMGLGKTVQAVSFLSVLSLLLSDSGPHLIISPASLLDNWQRELRKWGGGERHGESVGEKERRLRVLFYYGNERVEIRKEVERKARARERRGVEGGEGGEKDFEYNVVLTCYSMFERDSAAQKSDRSFLRSIFSPFSCVLLDEAHLLKDRESGRAKRVRKMSESARMRIMLTGTPLQNDLQELWSLMEFLMPGIFSSSSSSSSSLSTLFLKQLKENGRNLALANTKEESGSNDLIHRMKSILAPFVLRRVKSQVMDQLMPKEHKLELLPMPFCQSERYSKAVEEYRRRVMGAEGEGEREKEEGGARVESPEQGKGTEERDGAERDARNDSGNLAPTLSLPKKQIANIFTHLRKVANHPLLVRSSFSDEIISEISLILHRSQYFGAECTLRQVQEEIREYSDFQLHQICTSFEGTLSSFALPSSCFMESAKCKFLAHLLPSLLSSSHRVLLFSQWTSMLDILEHVLKREMGMKCCRLDGSTKVSERQNMVDEFNSDESIFAFLLSTRAGGQGLNLTGADTVIIHDVDFNPQIDRQAEDRCHRIGQTKKVTVFRLVSEGTVDENILRIAQRKLHLDAALLSNSENEQAVGLGGKGEGESGKVASRGKEEDTMASILYSLLTYKTSSNI